MTFQEINFHTNYKALGEMMLEFSKKKPKQSDKYIKALNEIYFYINSMHIENRELSLENSNIKQLIRKQSEEFYNYKNKTNKK